MQKLSDEKYIKERLHNIWTTSLEKENKKYNLTDNNLTKILQLKNKHENERCFIIGGSPSLKQLDLSKLNNEYTFTVNRGYQLKEKGLNHSTYHVITDKLLFMEDDITDEIPLDFMNNLLLYAGIKFRRATDNVIFYDYMHMMNYTEVKFQPDLTKVLAEGYCVIFTALQVAVYMGFSQIYIIGVDLDFNLINGHIYEETKGEINRQTKSHMNAQRMYDSIAYATEYADKIGIEVFNASPTGILDCMQRVNYDTLFNI